MPSAAERVGEALRGLGIVPEIQEFPQGTRTAEDAAAAVGTTVGQIVKSLVFLADGKPLLVLASGANRVDLIKLAAAVGAHTVRRADADTVRRVTGFSIGGVPPVGHETALPVVIDRDLLRYDVVYAAAGTPRAVFAITPGRLAEITRATPADVREG
ncbi:MAG TPA: YbaK/EbsC family protein [bacterium]|nr:YbaK/EbsC family protein [bacterium]